PGESPEHRAYMQRRLAHLDASVQQGGFPEAVVRALFYLLAARGAADGRDFRHVWKILHARLSDALTDEATFRRLARQQALLVRRMPEAAIAAIPHLLAHARDDEITSGIAAVREVEAHCGRLSDDECRRRDRLVALFDEARLSLGDLPAAAGPDTDAKRETTRRARRRKRSPRGTRAKKPR
ncbi:MAG: hypothetical protein ACREP2_11550, partial [Rhodanobacteraceae bacterium]